MIKPEVDILTHKVKWVPRYAYTAAVVLQSVVRGQPFVRREAGKEKSAATLSSISTSS